MVDREMHAFAQQNTMEHERSRTSWSHVPPDLALNLYKLDWDIQNCKKKGR